MIFYEGLCECGKTITEEKMIVKSLVQSEGPLKEKFQFWAGGLGRLKSTKNRFFGYEKSTRNRQEIDKKSIFREHLSWYRKTIIWIFLIVKTLVQSEGPLKKKFRFQLPWLGKLKSTKNRF